MIHHLFPRVPSLLLKIKLFHQIYKSRAAREGTRGNNRKITDYTDSAYFHSKATEKMMNIIVILTAAAVFAVELAWIRREGE